MVAFSFDNEKEKESLQKLLMRLSKGSLNEQQAVHFMKNNTPYKTSESQRSFLKKVKQNESLPIDKEGGKFIRTDLSQEVEM